MRTSWKLLCTFSSFSSISLKWVNTIYIHVHTCTCTCVRTECTNHKLKVRLKGTTILMHNKLIQECIKGGVGLCALDSCKICRWKTTKTEVGIRAAAAHTHQQWQWWRSRLSWCALPWPHRGESGMQTGRGSQPGWWAGTSTAAQRTAAVHVRDGEHTSTDCYVSGYVINHCTCTCTYTCICMHMYMKVHVHVYAYAHAQCHVLDLDSLRESYIVQLTETDVEVSLFLLSCFFLPHLLLSFPPPPAPPPPPPPPALSLLVCWVYPTPSDPLSVCRRGRERERGVRREQKKGKQSRRVYLTIAHTCIHYCNHLIRIYSMYQFIHNPSAPCIQLGV